MGIPLYGQNKDGDKLGTLAEGKMTIKSCGSSGIRGIFLDANFFRPPRIDLTMSQPYDILEEAPFFLPQMTYIV